MTHRGNNTYVIQEKTAWITPVSYHKLEKKGDCPEKKNQGWYKKYQVDLRN